MLESRVITIRTYWLSCDGDGCDARSSPKRSRQGAIQATRDARWRVSVSFDAAVTLVACLCPTCLANSARVRILAEWVKGPMQSSTEKEQ